MGDIKVWYFNNVVIEDIDKVIEKGLWEKCKKTILSVTNLTKVDREFVSAQDADDDYFIDDVNIACKIIAEMSI